MTKEAGNYYKICRNTSGLSQEQASDLLNVTVHTLSKYENGHAKVPDDLVVAMTEHYKAPLLAWWHLKNTSVLGKFLPDIIMPQTNGDMAFQLIMAKDEIKSVAKEVMKIMSDGVIDDSEEVDFIESMELIRKVNAKLFSIIVYAEQMKRQ